MKIIKQLFKLLLLPSNDRSRIFRQRIERLIQEIIALINTSPLNLNLGYKPDRFSQIDKLNLSSKEELKNLKQKFVKYNKRNNNGDLSRFYSLILNLEQLAENNVTGDFAELGVYKGNTAAILAYYATRQQRRCILFDTFSGFDSKDLVGIDNDKVGFDFSSTSIKLVEELIGDCISTEFVPGWFPGSLTIKHMENHYAAVSLDCDLYEPMLAGLEFFYPRLTSGGILFIHDYSSGLWPGVKKAVDYFFDTKPDFLILLPDKSGTAIIRKQ